MESVGHRDAVELAPIAMSARSSERQDGKGMDRVVAACRGLELEG
jgi:hypothetical protein